MSIKQSLIQCVPSWLLLLATDARCLFRCFAICREIPYQAITNNRSLVVAPHPDDETFGCGGLIKMKCSAGAPVRVILLTDGEAVGSGKCENLDLVIEARRREFVNACQRLGLEADSLRWLHLPDGKLPHPGQPGFDEAVKALATEIGDYSPSEIYCPHLRDVHPDHIAANLMTREAMCSFGRSCAISSYPVWMWYQASLGLRKRLDCQGAWRLDISSVLYAKKQAVAAYLDAPQKTAAGHPFCGRLPLSFLWNFRRRYEVYFPASDS